MPGHVEQQVTMVLQNLFQMKHQTEMVYPARQPMDKTFISSPHHFSTLITTYENKLGKKDKREENVMIMELWEMFSGNPQVLFSFKHSRQFSYSSFF